MSFTALQRSLTLQVCTCQPDLQCGPQEEYQEALDVLLLAEEAFAMCNPKHLEMVDNVGLLMIDIVW